MRRIRVTVDDNETGISAELTFTARTACVEEGRQIRHQGPRLTMDVTRFAQFGKWDGEIRYDGKSVRIDPARVYGTKDRSWGVRPVGAPDRGVAPAAGVPAPRLGVATLRHRGHPFSRSSANPDKPSRPCPETCWRAGEKCIGNGS